MSNDELIPINHCIFTILVDRICSDKDPNGLLNTLSYDQQVNLALQTQIPYLIDTISLTLRVASKLNMLNNEKRQIIMDQVRDTIKTYWLETTGKQSIEYATAMLYRQVLQKAGLEV
jgi:hypothetical protein